MKNVALVTTTLALAALSGGSAIAQGTWTQLSPAAAPSQRQDHAMESFGTHIILFGGADSKTTPVLNDTWSWDGANWTQLSPATTPTGVTGHTMSYDPVRNRIVMFGGSTVPAGQVNYINETWEWDGNDWSQMNPVTSPPVRDWSDMAYDPATNSTILFAGRDSNNKPSGSYVPYNDTWSWDGTNWTQRFPTNSPPVRHGHRIVFDKNLNKILLAGGGAPGGIKYADSWAWDGTDWSQLTPTTGYPGREFISMDFDDSRDVMVLHAGKNSSAVLVNDTWEFDGTTWTQAATTGPFYGWFPMIYDTVNSKMLVQGGAITKDHSASDGLTFYYGVDTTWTNLGSSLPGALGSPDLDGQGALIGGTSVTLTLSNAAPNTTSGLFIGTSNVSLPLYGGTLVPSPTLFLLIPLGAGGGYSIPAIYPMGLPAGIPFYFQAWIADATGPQGFAASNALTTMTQ